MKTIPELCAAYRRASYYLDSHGMVGVRNLRGEVVWFAYFAAREAYCPTGETSTPGGAELKKLEAA